MCASCQQQELARQIAVRHGCAFLEYKYFTTKFAGCLFYHCCSQSHFCDQTQRKATSHTLKVVRCVARKMMRYYLAVKIKETHIVTHGPCPKGWLQKATHLICIMQRWQQLATLLLNLPSHHFLFLGQTWDSLPELPSGRW